MPCQGVRGRVVYARVQTPAHARARAQTTARPWARASTPARSRLQTDGARTAMVATLLHNEGNWRWSPP
eukprot:9977613-Lingulodinium_polyedra.AAC.1